MSDPSRSNPGDDDHSFWADQEPQAEPESTRRAWLHSRVFGLGVLTIAGTVLGLAGLTWAGSDATQLSAAQIAAAKAAPAGACTFTVDGRPAPLEAVAARTLTMIAAVGHQVAAPDIQIARAIDVAMGGQGTRSAQVVDALALLAKDDAVPATKTGLAQLRAIGTPGALTCRYTPLKLATEKMNDAGLTKRADKARTAVLDAFGKLPTSGYTKPDAKAKAKADAKAKAAKAKSKAKSESTSESESKDAKATTAPAASPASEGRAVDIELGSKDAPDAALDATAKSRGWLLAHWLVARGDVYKLEGVAFDDHTWSAASAAGWQTVAPDSTTRNLDRVHITVQRGG